MHGYNNHTPIVPLENNSSESERKAIKDAVSDPHGMVVHHPVFLTGKVSLSDMQE